METTIEGLGLRVDCAHYFTYPEREAINFGTLETLHNGEGITFHCCGCHELADVWCQLVSIA